MMPPYEAHVCVKFRLSDHSRLTCSPNKKYLQLIHFWARDMCHVAPVDPRPAPSSFRRFGASNGAAPVAIGPAVWPPEPEMLGQTDI